ncbi:MAG: aminodeoxychorismate/anthranilate synthase component II [Phycisphaerales bacterium]|nr:aminodeoxychorismate/anthranilate synthase component II [Phycisphaerales bacterium]
MLLIIDNYDSFTYNLVQRIGELDAGIDMRVVRNDQITVEEAAALDPTHLLISPGPCTPKESGVSPRLIEHFRGRIPILGVCLGHQAIADVHGMTVKRHSVLMHGKTSEIHHDGIGIFEGVPNPFTATRYHSLIVDRKTVSDEFEVSAWTQANEIMGLRWRRSGISVEPQRPEHRTGKNGPKRIVAPMDGVQFHPESFLTVEGPKLLANFLKANAV